MQKKIKFYKKIPYHLILSILFFFSADLVSASISLRSADLSGRLYDGLNYDSRDPGEVGKNKLKIGIVDVNTIPYVMRDENQLEGVIPDLLIAMERFGSLDLELIPYKSEVDALAELSKGNVDALAGFIKKPILNNLLISQPIYTPVYVEVVNKNNFNKNIKSVAVVKDSIIRQFVELNYLGSKIIEFESDLAAIDSVNSGAVDLYIGTLLGSNYLTNSLQTKKLKILGYPSINGVSFSLVSTYAKKNTIQLIDKSIGLVPSVVKNEILKHWGGGKNQFNLRESVNFSEEELLWIKKNPVVKYAAFQNLVPFIFSNGHESKLVGLTVDVMSIIEENTGLVFQPVIYKLGINTEKELMNGNVDVLPFSVSGVGTNDDLIRSRPYAKFQSRIYARENDQKISVREDLSGKIIARSIYSNFSEAHIMSPPIVPEPRYISISNDLFGGLLDKKYDAILINSISADYLIAQSYLKKVRYIGLSNDFLSEVSFSSRQNNRILVDIIDKSLMKISTEEIQSLQQAWTSNRSRTLKFGLDDAEYELAVWMLSLLSLIIVLVFLLATWKAIKNKNVKKNLEGQLDLLRSIVNALPFAVYVINKSGDVLICNNHYLVAFNQDSAEKIDSLRSSGLNVSKFLEEINQLRLNALENKKPIYKNKSCFLGNKEHDFLMWLLPLSSTSQSESLFLGGWQDISEQKEVERELLRSRLEAESANLAKNTFLAIISHEIRTPMNAILGLIELQIKRPIAPDKNSLRIVYSSANSLLSLINDILDYSKAESGAIGVELKPCSINLLIESIGNIYRDLAREKGIELIINCSADIPAAILFDPLRFKQLIGNLVGNALKFTDHGFVAVDLNWDTVDEFKGVLKIAIKDTGIGISPENTNRIFEAFEQEDTTIHEKYGGSGLGLWICNKILNEMRGSIEIESDIGNGTEFYLSIPAEIVNEQSNEMICLETHSQEIFDANKIKVLIVDDHPANLLVLQQQFKYLGFDLIYLAENGEEALEKLYSQEFNILVTDCSMPKMDGFQLAKAVRLEDRFQGIMIVGFTADARSEIHKKAISSGMDHCLIKPVSLDQLTQCMRKYVKNEGVKKDVDDKIEIEKVIALFSGADTLVEEKFLSTLIDSNNKDLEELLKCMKENKFSNAFDIAHRLKGAAHLIKARTVVDLCLTLEDALNTNDIKKIEVASRSLNNELIYLNERLTELLNARRKLNNEKFKK